MKLIKEDIENIDNWLKWIGIKYIDIRYELIDHLVTEYQQIENYPDLKSFLMDRRIWCRKVAKEKQKAVNFGTTKALFKKFLSFFTNFQSLPIVFLMVFLILGYENLVSDKVFKFSFLAITIILIGYETYLMLYSGFGNDLKKESVSVKYLLNIFLLPQMPFYFIGSIPNHWIANTYFSIPFIVAFILMHLAAIAVFREKRRLLLKEIELLKQ